MLKGEKKEGLWIQNNFRLTRKTTDNNPSQTSSGNGGKTEIQNEQHP